MALIVQKYGGSSVADTESIKRVAKRVVETEKKGNKVAVVVSAMGDTTDDLIDQALSIDSNPPEREMDMLMTAGERISMSLLAMAIHAEGSRAHSFTGQQAGFFTDARYGAAHIKAVRPDRVKNALSLGDIAIVAGFQGINAKGDATTLGRGGSDTSAVALAVALGADICEIYTDVDGIFTADPRIVPSAPFRPSITSPFWRWRPAAPRCWHCAVWNTLSVSTCRCTCVPRSPVAPAHWWCPTALTRVRCRTSTERGYSER